jgi:hypothetical protein
VNNAETGKYVNFTIEKSKIVIANGETHAKI